VAATADGFTPRIPRLAFLTDLDHLARSYRRRYRPSQSLKGKIYQLIDALADRELPNLISTLLSDCEIVFDHASHHCQWLRDHGVTQAKYLPVPVLDHPGADWYSSRQAARLSKNVPKISLIGNVSGIATLPGLYILASGVLPRLEEKCGTNGFEVHILGSGRLPPDLLRALNKRYVKLRGYVEDIHAEFRSSDILLVPTPIELGFRTRIAEGFSFGCCVVAHRANARGMPELRDRENVLLADTGEQLADAVLRCLDSPELRERLGAQARATFEQQLDGRIVCDQMVNELERVVLSRKCKPVHLHSAAIMRTRRLDKLA
jgi:glycosyltransferase involved in cell wall biosynthesis